MTSFLMESLEDSTLALARFLAEKMGEQQGARLVAQVEAFVAQGDQISAASTVVPSIGGLKTASVEDRRSALTMLMAVASKVAPRDVPRAVDVLLRAAESASGEDKLAALVDLFNFTPGSARLPVLNAILALGAADSGLAGKVAAMVRGKSQGWAKEWRLSGPDAAALHFATAAAAKAAGAGAAELMSLYNTALVSLDRQPLSQAGPGAAAAVTDACKLFLGSSEIFECDMLLSSATQQASKGAEMAALEAMVAGDVQGLKGIVAKNGGLPDACGTTADAMVRKTQAMALLALAHEAQGAEVPYSKIMERLQVSEDEVESRVVEIVGMGLVKAKMDQVRRVVVCTRWTHRTLDTVNWQQMRERLVRVKEALQSSAEAIRAASVLEVTPALSGDTATVTA